MAETLLKRNKKQINQSYSYFQASTEVLSYWAAETLIALHSISRAMTQWPNVKCMIPILMDEMRISTAYVSLVMLRPKKLEIRNIMTVNTPSTPHTPNNNKQTKSRKRESAVTRRIELCMREINLRFEIKYTCIKCNVFLTFAFSNTYLST
jgi:hypothetical protein